MSVSELRSDLAYALRRLRLAPGFAALTVLTLALGIGASTAIFSVVNAVVLRPIPVPDAECVVQFYETNPTNNAWTTSEPNYLDYRDRTRTFATFAAVSGRGASLLGRGDPIALNGLAATATYFPLFGARPLVGTVYGPDQDHPGGDTRVVVLSEGIWRRLFGASRAVVGATVNLDGAPYRVLGVMPNGFGFLPSDF